MNILETVSGILCKRLNIDGKEISKTVLVSLMAFLVIFSYYLIKPSKDSLFIQYMGSESMPTAFIIIPAMTFIFLLVYDCFVRKLNRRIFGISLVTFFIINIFVFWILFVVGYKKQAAYGLYIWSDIFSVALVTFFWSLTNDIYTSELAKKVYGILGIGAQLGGVLGSFVTRRLAGVTETENIILLSIPFLIIIIFFIMKIDRIADQSATEQSREKTVDAKAQISHKSLSEIFKNFLMVMRSKHLFYLTILLCTMLLCSNLMNYQIGRILEISVADKGAKTAFYAGRYFQSTSLSVLFLLIASYFYGFFGVFGTLYTLPSFNLLTVTLFLFCPSLCVVAFSKVIDESLKYGIIQVTREMLYIPCTKEEKYRAKAVIDILFYRITKVISGLLMIFFSNIIVLSIQNFNFVIISVLVANLLVLTRLKGAYIERLENRIQNIFDENSEFFKDGASITEIYLLDKNQALSRLSGTIDTEVRKETEEISVPEAITIDLPSLESISGKLYRNETIKKVIILVSRFYDDHSINSLCMQYLNLALPPGSRKKSLSSFKTFPNR